MYLATKSTIFPNLDLESKPEIRHINILGYVFSIAVIEIKYTARGFIDL